MTKTKQIEEFREKFLGKALAQHDPFTHANYPTTWVEKMLNIKDLEQWLETALKAEISKKK